MKKGYKLFYAFQCPMGADDSKIGITGHPEVRFGTYQNSYSRNSHLACFNLVYVGPTRAIENLERVVKQRYDWSIEMDGRGHSEWINNHTVSDIEKIIDELIDGFKFKIRKIDPEFLPLSMSNIEDFHNSFEEENS